MMLCKSSSTWQDSPMEGLQFVTCPSLTVCQCFCILVKLCYLSSQQASAELLQVHSLVGQHDDGGREHHDGHAEALQRRPRLGAVHLGGGLKP